MAKCCSYIGKHLPFRSSIYRTIARSFCDVNTHNTNVLVEDGERKPLSRRERRLRLKEQYEPDGHQGAITEQRNKLLHETNLLQGDSIESLLKDASTSEPGEEAEQGEFPSDMESYMKWHQLQQRHSFRPKINPTETSILLFPGQGSQFVGMGKEVLGYPNVQEMYDSASDILGFDLLNLCMNGPKSELDKTVHCQPAVMVTSLAAAEALKATNPEAVETCVTTAGFSVGEYAALVFAGAMSFQDAVRVLKVRAEGMQFASEQEASGMMTVFLQPSSKLGFAMLAAQEYCRQKLHMHDPVCRVANYLYPECKVIAGHDEVGLGGQKRHDFWGPNDKAIDSITKMLFLDNNLCGTEGVHIKIGMEAALGELKALNFIESHLRDFGIRRTKRLAVSGAFHTSLMGSARPELQKALRTIDIKTPIIPVHSNVTYKQYRNADDIVKNLSKQITAAVKWEQIIHTLYSRNIGVNFPYTYEMGPGKQLGTLLKLVNKKAHESYHSVLV